MRPAPRGNHVLARPASLSLLLFLALLSAACGTCERAQKDATLGAAAPALVLYRGSVDGWETATQVGEASGGGSAASALVFPLTCFYHALEHSTYGLIHLVDLPLCAAYGCAELLPFGPEIVPLDLYGGSPFHD